MRWIDKKKSIHQHPSSRQASRREESSIIESSRSSCERERGRGAKKSKPDEGHVVDGVYQKVPSRECSARPIVERARETKSPSTLPLPHRQISLILVSDPGRSVSDIKLIRTDTTLDLSQRPRSTLLSRSLGLTPLRPPRSEMLWEGRSTFGDWHW
mgnify:FL=1